MDEATSGQTGTALREVRTPVARRLADAVAELHDVLFARHAVEELLNSWPTESPTGPDTRSIDIEPATEMPTSAW